MNTFLKSIIAPETIAEKLASAFNLSDPGFAAMIDKEPRLVELLWFIQWASMQPGGLEKWALSVVEQFGPMFGPAILNDQSAKISYEQRREMFGRQGRENLIPGEKWRSPTTPYNEDNYTWDGTRIITPAEEQRLRPLLMEITPAQFQAAFIEAAKKELAGHLRSMAAGPGKWLTTAPWWGDNLVAVLFKAMDAHAARVAQELAPTQIVSAVFETLDFAWHQKALVQIEGESRFGKTESIKAWCRMHPGRARLILTPASNFDCDMYKALAESLGVSFTYSTVSSKLKAIVEFIIRNSGLMFVFDEAHFLLPQRMSGTTLPTRLNWTRTQIIDRKLPVAIVTTPQAFTHAVNKFTRSTGFNFEQLLGRIAHTATLPDSLPQDDLLAIARFHAPDLAEPLQKIIVGKALQQQSYIAAVENIIRRARWNASRACHAHVTLEDVDLAAAGRLHGQAPPPEPAPARPAPAPKPVAVRRGRATTPAAPAPALEMPAGRNVTPAPAPAAAALDSSRHSLATAEAPARSITPVETLHPV